MLNYIATDITARLIQKICKSKNILILQEVTDITNISKYLKETKVNFNLVKFFIIELACIDNLEDEIIESIYNFSRLHSKTRIIILAQGFNENSNILNQLYEKEIYNIINTSDELDLENQIIRTLSEEGIQKKEAKRFEKIEEVTEDKKKTKKLKKNTEKIEVNKKEVQGQIMHQSSGVYFFALLLEAVTRLVRLIGYIAVFVLTSIGITILLNSQLREMVLQIFSLE